MPLSSAKFKYLEIARPYLKAGVVPQFELMGSNDFGMINWGKPGPRILRSALKNEASELTLLSGKSISIGGIESNEALQNALSQCSSQADLQEVMLQKEVPWIEHLTVIVESEFFFCEVRDRNGQTRTFFRGGLTRTSSEPLSNPLLQVLKPLAPILDSKPLWLLELGWASSGLHLFQIQPIGRSAVDKIFTSQLARQQVASRERFTHQKGLFTLLRNEWQALAFRKRVQTGTPHSSDVFLNWEFIFHYFRIFCMIRNLRPTGEAYAAFLSSVHSSSPIANLSLTHIRIANELRAQEAFLASNSRFEGDTPLFIGKGIIEGTSNDAILVTRELTPESLHSETKPKAILTDSVSILSHGVLAGVENGIGLVLGVPLPLLEEARLGKPIRIDFKNQTISIK